jgi:septum formation protein
MSDTLPLVLASASPRRRELLTAVGFVVECAPAEVDERPLPGEAPPEHVLRIAREKAIRVATRRPGGPPVLGADTIVVLGDEILGKPATRADARRMLVALSGRRHTVLTAVCVTWAGRTATHLESSRVTFGVLSPELLEWYLETGEGDDKAGGYAVQGLGGILVAAVDGNVQAVVGLPLAPLPALFARVGLTVSPRGAALTLSPRAWSARPAR